MGELGLLSCVREHSFEKGYSQGIQGRCVFAGALSTGGLKLSGLTDPADDQFMDCSEGQPDTANAAASRKCDVDCLGHHILGGGLVHFKDGTPSDQRARFEGTAAFPPPARRERWAAVTSVPMEQVNHQAQDRDAARNGRFQSSGPGESFWSPIHCLEDPAHGISVALFSAEVAD
jgi:hypothetical protein